MTPLHRVFSAVLTGIMSCGMTGNTCNDAMIATQSASTVQTSNVGIFRLCTDCTRVVAEAC
jgi:hypothetical protein